VLYSYGRRKRRLTLDEFPAIKLAKARELALDERDIEASRYKLATALLAEASADSRDAQALKKAALQRMALDLPPPLRHYAAVRHHLALAHRFLLPIAADQGRRNCTITAPSFVAFVGCAAVGPACQSRAAAP